MAEEGSTPLRWYAVHTQRGQEHAAAEKCRRVVPAELLQRCFVPRAERYMKRSGAWQIVEHPLFSEYFLVATRDVRALNKALSQLLTPMQMIGKQGSGMCAPLEPQVQTWLGDMLDADGVLRASEGVIESGKLQVSRGPLRGREADVRKIDRHHRCAYVHVHKGVGTFATQQGAGDGQKEEGFSVKAALNVSQKS